MKKYLGMVALIHMSAMSKTPRQFPAWELPLMEEQYGGKLEVEGEIELTYEDEPDVDVLLEQYVKRGEDERGFSYLELAYGRGSQAKKALTKAIKDAELKGGKKPKAAKPKPAPKPKPESEPEPDVPESPAEEKAEGEDPLG